MTGLMSCATVRVVHEPGDASPRPASLDGRSVVVRAGDTLYGIASQHGVKVGDLAEWNALRAPYTIHPGQRLVLAPVAAALATTTPASAASAVTSAPLVESVPRAAATASGTSKWQWPADGALVTRASATTPGIDIAGRASAPVRAVADGVVLYSGAGSPGYEELIVIRHDNDWLSSYAHNRKRLVGEGQRVRAGAQIAEMGRTGATRDLLHFEMRRDGELFDPLKVLPPR